MQAGGSRGLCSWAGNIPAVAAVQRWRASEGAELHPVLVISEELPMHGDWLLCSEAAVCMCLK